MDPVAAVTAALTTLGVCNGERVLLLIPDGACFIDAFVGALNRDVVPLPVNPALSASDIVATAADAGARLVVVTAERVPALTDLAAEPPVLLDGPKGLWAAVLRLR